MRKHSWMAWLAGESGKSESQGKGISKSLPASSKATKVANNGLDEAPSDELNPKLRFSDKKEVKKDASNPLPRLSTPTKASVGINGR